MKKQLEENEQREKCLKKMHERRIHSCALIAGMCTFVCEIELHLVCCYYLVLATPTYKTYLSLYRLPNGPR
jgi:hypothetical protein